MPTLEAAREIAALRRTQAEEEAGARLRGSRTSKTPEGAPIAPTTDGSHRNPPLQPATRTRKNAPRRSFLRRAALAGLAATALVVMMAATLALARERATLGYAAYMRLIEAAVTVAQPAAFRVILAPEQPSADLGAAALSPLQSMEFLSLKEQLQTTGVPAMAMTLAPAAGLPVIATLHPLAGSLLGGLVYTAAAWSHALMSVFLCAAGLGILLL